MVENVATVIDWFGPYEGDDRTEILKKARQAAAKDYKGGLYAPIGHVGVRRGPRQLLYMGIGAKLHQRLNERHHRMGQMSISSIWLGEISVHGAPGRRSKKTAPHLDVAEWASAYFLDLPFNERKKTPPRTSCIVLNRWWGTDYSTPAECPVRGWADIIEYDAWRGIANLVWFGTRVKKGKVVKRLVK